MIKQYKISDILVTLKWSL